VGWCELCFWIVYASDVEWRDGSMMVDESVGSLDGRQWRLA